jgi:hypothetical protein
VKDIARPVYEGRLGVNLGGRKRNGRCRPARSLIGGRGGSSRLSAVIIRGCRRTRRSASFYIGFIRDKCVATLEMLVKPHE